MLEKFFQRHSGCNCEDPFWGRMTAPTASARIQGPCGDDMEFYLDIYKDKIVDVKYYTEAGCCNTRTAGRSVSRRVIGKNIYKALEVNPGVIIREETGLSEDGKHCAILATTTFYRAIALYLLNRAE
jgi:nitrogen fixation NifU-like protein